MSARNLLEQVGHTPQRAVYLYDIPGDLPIKSVGLVELRADEELMAAKRAHGDPMRLAYELAKQCLVEVDGKPVGLGDGSTDTAFDSMGPKARNLILAAYGELHSPEENDAKAFLKSRKVRVG